MATLYKINQLQGRWRYRSMKHIERREWDQIQCYRGDEYSQSCDWSIMDQWLFRSLLGMDPFVPEIESTLLRLFGKDIQEKGWLYHLIVMCPSVSALEYFLARDLGDLNRSYEGSTLLEHVLFRMSYSVEDRVRLLHLLIEKGADINLLSEWGKETPIFRCVDAVCNVWTSAFLLQDEDVIRETERRKQNYSLIAHSLLDHGADPLLENHHGVSAKAWLENVGESPLAEQLLERMIRIG